MDNLSADVASEVAAERDGPDEDPPPDYEEAMAATTDAARAWAKARAALRGAMTSRGFHRKGRARGMGGARGDAAGALGAFPSSPVAARPPAGKSYVRACRCCTDGLRLPEPPDRRRTPSEGCRGRAGIGYTDLLPLLFPP